MSFSRNILVVGSAILLVATGAGSAFAQERGGREEKMQERGGREERMQEQRKEHFLRYCEEDTTRFHPVVKAYVRADLKLTEAQAKDFDAWADLVLPGLEQVKDAMCEGARKEDPTAPEKITSLSNVLRRGADLADKAQAPTQRFYASLNDQQKERFNSYFERGGWGFPMRLMRMGPGHHGGMMNQSGDMKRN